MVEDVGVRFNWNVLPSTRLQAYQAGQIACNLNLQKSLELELAAESKHFWCINLGCKAIFNSLCWINKSATLWKCCICLTVNDFGPNVDLNLVNSTQKTSLIGYQGVIPQDVNTFISHSTQLHVFLVDICTDAQELMLLKDSLIETIDLLPANSLVSIVTFSDTVNFHKVHLKNAYPFGEHTRGSLEDVLFGKNHVKGQILSYCYRIESDMEMLKNYITELIPSLNANIKGQRSVRMTGKAIQLTLEFVQLFKQEAALFFHAKNKNAGLLANVVVFVSGPCTLGPGKIVSLSMKTPLRNHSVVQSFSELNRSNKAIDFYTKLAYDTIRTLTAGHDKETSSLVNISVRISIFSASLDNTGLFEMQNLCHLSDGKLVLSDGFGTNIFRQNLHMLFKNSEPYTAGTLEILTSPGLKINGAVGPLVSANNHSKYASDMKIGEALTNVWILGSFDEFSNYTFFFEQEDLSVKPPKDLEFYCIQFKLKYMKNGLLKTRIITVKKPLGFTPSEIVLGFDTKCFVITMLRKITYESMLELKPNISVQVIDEKLRDLLVSFGRIFIDESHLKQKPEGFIELAKFHDYNLNYKFNTLPELFYFARKSFIFNKFNVTPDETSVYNHYLLNNDISSSLLAIRPVLYQIYKPQDSSQNALRQLPLHSSILSDISSSVLILDDYFHVLIHFGSSIAYYRDYYKKHVDSLADLDSIDMEKITASITELKSNETNSLDPVTHVLKTEDFAAIFQLIKSARKKVLDLISDRQLLPRYIETDENKSQARFLYSRLVPMDASSYDIYSGIGRETLTDEIGLNDYYKNILQ